MLRQNDLKKENKNLPTILGDEWNPCHTNYSPGQQEIQINVF
jgi:hypothetical protein